MGEFDYIRNNFESMDLRILKDIVENKKDEYVEEAFQIAIEVLEERLKNSNIEENFYEEAENMSKREILLALEQPELYNDKEIGILKRKLEKKINESKNKKTIVNEAEKLSNSSFDKNKDFLDNNIPKKASDNIFWTKFLRIITTINIIVGVFIGIGGWIYIAQSEERGGILIGGICAFIWILLVLIANSFIMVFVEISENISKSKNILETNQDNTSKIINWINQKNK